MPARGSTSRSVARVRRLGLILLLFHPARFTTTNRTEPSETKRKGTDSRAVEAKRWIRPLNGAWRVDAGDDAK